MGIRFVYLKNAGDFTPILRFTITWRGQLRLLAVTWHTKKCDTRHRVVVDRAAIRQACEIHSRSPATQQVSESALSVLFAQSQSRLSSSCPRLLQFPVTPARQDFRVPPATTLHPS